MKKERNRKFATGATRSDDQRRDDLEGFTSPIVLDRYNEYMNKHRVQANGTVRESDNWQKGMPVSTYMKGMTRHHLHAWTRHRGFLVRDPQAAANLEEDLCAIMFNAQGYLFELLKPKFSADTEHAVKAAMEAEFGKPKRKTRKGK